MSYDPTKPYKAQLLELIQSTWHSPHLKIRPGIYPIFERTTSGEEVDHTDGLGTKGEYHWQHKTFRAAVADALAMNLNDLAMARAKAYKLQNHLTLPIDDHQAILSIIESLARECQQRQIVMTGGETSIHQGGAFDLSLTVSGLVVQQQPNTIQPGDVVLGLPSSGLHSNGFTKVREIFGADDRPEFTTPTTIYSDMVLSLIERFEIHGLMHITGGAFTKLHDIGQGVDIHITGQHQLKPPPIFYELHERGVIDDDMYRTFNCGIGFILTASPEMAEQITKTSLAVVIGQAVNGNGRITIESQFSQHSIRL